MDITDQIIEMENRAKAVGLSVNELCFRANVARTTLTRWKNKTSSPNTSTLAKLESVITKYSFTKKPPATKKLTSN